MAYKRTPVSIRKGVKAKEINQKRKQKIMLFFNSNPEKKFTVNQVLKEVFDDQIQHALVLHLLTSMSDRPPHYLNSLQGTEKGRKIHQFWKNNDVQINKT